MSVFARVLYGGLGAIAGFTFCGLLLARDLLKFDTTVTGGNILQAFATLFGAVIVAIYFQRALQSDRKEKDLLLRQLDLLLESLGDVERYKDGGVLTEVTAAIKKVSIQSQFATKLLHELNYAPAICDLVGLDGDIRTIRELATETPVRELEKMGNDLRRNSTVRDGFIRLAEEKKLMLDGRIQDVKMKIIKAQLLINRV